MQYTSRHDACHPLYGGFPIKRHFRRSTRLVPSRGQWVLVIRSGRMLNGITTPRLAGGSGVKTRSPLAGRAPRRASSRGRCCPPSTIERAAGIDRSEPTNCCHTSLRGASKRWGRLGRFQRAGPLPAGWPAWSACNHSPGQAPSRVQGWPSIRSDALRRGAFGTQNVGRAVLCIGPLPFQLRQSAQDPPARSRRFRRPRGTASGSADRVPE